MLQSFETRLTGLNLKFEYIENRLIARFSISKALRSKLFLILAEVDISRPEIEDQTHFI